MADDVLHDTHEWGERTHRGDTIPYCTVCRVDGYEDEPAAFAVCPGEPPKKGGVCGVTMKSKAVSGHTHRCGAAHTTGDHHCPECSRWFGVS